MSNSWCSETRRRNSAEAVVVLAGDEGLGSGTGRTAGDSKVKLCGKGEDVTPTMESIIHG